MPLAEWIASNWWFLCEEAPLTAHVGSARSAHAGPLRAWFLRHNWLFAREGFPLPDLTIARIDEGFCMVSAAPDPLTTAGAFPVRFIERCSGTAGVEEVRAALGALVDAVVARLEGDNGADSVALRARWDEIRNMPSDDRALRERAAAAGLDGDDPSEVSDELAAALVFGLESFPRGLRRDVLDAHPARDAIKPLFDQLHALRSRSHEVRATDALGAARRAVSGALLSEERPFEAGWKLARAFRTKVLGLDDVCSSADLRAGIEREQLLKIMSLSFEPADRSVRSWVRADTNDTALCVLAASTAEAAAFAFASSVGLALLDPRERLATRAATRPQSIARAFATELLCPEAWIRSKVDSPFVRRDQIDLWASERGVHREPVVHQIENHGLAIVEET